ncbi:MAG: TRAP transporter substrate-binding protein [Chloroflexi bacterium]|nr:TRAP transporter substrate-binding protein [Chloroflexota bacterium]
MADWVTRRRFLQYLSVGAGGALVSACTPPPPPQAKPEAAKPAAPEPAKPAAPAPAQPPASAAAPPAGSSAPSSVSPSQTIVLKTQSTWATKDIFHETFVDFGKKVEEMSGGRLKLDILPNGAVVPFAQVIDAVHQGVLDGGHGVPAYWFGKNKAASLFGTGPSFGMDADMFLGWIHYGGGQELYNELIQQTLKLDVQSFFHGPMATQPLGWFRNEVRSADDLKGQKYRTVGLSADLFKELGASVVILAGGEVVPALERGVIDSAEFNNPSSDKLLGFPDVRKILMVQSYHQPVESLEFLINKKKYDSLPKDLQAILKYAAMAQSADTTWKYFMDRNANDLKEMREKNGVRVTRTPKSILEAQLKAWDTIVKRESEADPFFAKVIKSQQEWAGRVVPLRQEVMVENETAFNHYFKRA